MKRNLCSPAFCRWSSMELKGSPLQQLIRTAAYNTTALGGEPQHPYELILVLLSGYRHRCSTSHPHCLAGWFVSALLNKQVRQFDDQRTGAPATAWMPARPTHTTHLAQSCYSAGRPVRRSRQWWGVQRVRQEARGDHDRSSSQSTSDVAVTSVCS